MGDLIHEILYPSEGTQQFFNVIFLVLTIASTVVSGLFALSYRFLYKWKKRPAGRATMYLVQSLFFTFLVIDLARINPDYPGRVALTLLVYSAIFVTLLKLLGTLWYWYGREPHDHSQEPPRRPLDDTVPKRSLPKG